MGTTWEMTLAGALTASQCGEIGEWVHAYLTTVGSNPEMAEGLRRQKRHWFGPIMLELNRLPRCCGPELEMEYQVDSVRFNQRVDGMIESILQGWEPPPLIASCYHGTFSVRDGNHRHAALVRSGRTSYWTIIWFDDEACYQAGKTTIGSEAQYRTRKGCDWYV